MPVKLPSLSPKLRLVALVVAGLVALVILWFAIGGLTGYLDSRAARNDAAAQKKIADQAAKEAQAAKADAQKWLDQYNQEKGRADALDEHAKALEQERAGFLDALASAHAATAGARTTYDAARRGQAPRRAPLASQAETDRRRLAELCELYPDDPQCKP